MRSLREAQQTHCFTTLDVGELLLGQQRFMLL